MPITDKIVLEGNISRINDKELDKYIWFDICKNEKYQTKEGEMKENSSFFSVKIDKDRIDNKDLFKVGSWIVVTGIPKSFLDKNNMKQFYIFALKIEDAKIFKINDEKQNSQSPKITYDPDGVMVWDGKRCESESATPEEIAEMEDLLSEFK